ncbi:MAG: hypothetical protein ACD_77C00495G0002 [uncultured bacterium]|nr:MAG: hypothetical protein ACD_77C00495G0002 [uncultured bacterium]HBY01292.1 hypothetical protein [Rikenellaceae bacterium]
MRFFISFLVFVTTFGPLYSQSPKSGSQFYEEMRNLPFNEREDLIVKEITSGNIPDFLRRFVPVKTVQKDSEGRNHKITLFVTADYLAVGNNLDYFTVPMSPVSAQKIADSMGASLPTPKVVDIIYEKCELKLEPFNYIPRVNRNETPDILNDHSRVIQAQIKASGNSPGIFVAGTKKDIVISSKLIDPKRTHHVTIYGWHRLNGVAIQPPTNVHIDIYVDYSHGVRLISNRVIVDGKEYEYRKLLSDPLLHTLLSGEKEPLLRTSYLVENPSEKR